MIFLLLEGGLRRMKETNLDKRKCNVYFQRKLKEQSLNKLTLTGNVGVFR